MDRGMDRPLEPAVSARRRLRRWLLIGVGLAVLTFCYAGAVRWLRPTADLKTLRLVAVERGTIEARLQASGTIEPLGSSTTRKADVWIVSATNQPLPSMVAVGSFREDLDYRLNLIELRLPPLRDRRSDIPLLAEHFLAGIRRVSGRVGLLLAPAAGSWLEQQD
jgi:hypothetical protein